MTKTPTPATTAGLVFGYARVSTGIQVQHGVSLSEQQSRIEGYAKSIGRDIDEMFVEAGVSGGKELSKRPKGRLLLARLNPGDILIATKLDRLFRSAKDALCVVEDLKSKQISVHLLDIGGNVSENGVSKLVFQILSAVAEMEKSRISERVREAKSHLKSVNQYLGGKIPKGHRIVRGKVVQDEKWALVLKQMKSKQENGDSFESISRWVKKIHGISMSGSTCFRILKRGGLRSGGKTSI